MGNIYDNIRYIYRRDKEWLEYDDRYDKEGNLSGIYKEYMILRDDEDMLKESPFPNTIDFLRYYKRICSRWFDDKE